MRNVFKRQTPRFLRKSVKAQQQLKKPRPTPQGFNYFIRHSRTSPPVGIAYYPMLRAESQRIDELLQILQDIGYLHYQVTAGQAAAQPHHQPGRLDLLDLVFDYADTEGIVSKTLGIDPASLTTSLKQLLYLFAIGRTGLLNLVGLNDTQDEPTEEPAMT